MLLLLSRLLTFFFLCFHTSCDAVWEILAHIFIIISKPAVPTKWLGRENLMSVLSHG